MSFIEWLRQNYTFTLRTRRDIESRLLRAKRFLKQEYITDQSISDLEADPEFKSLSHSVQSQMRRAIRLYLQYENEGNQE